jgi:hypothetical protein
MRLAGLLMFGWLAVPVGASARMLEVGPQRALKTPSAAARIAEPGDQIVIDPGEYFDCAFWRTNGITIAAAPGDPVVFTDRSCGGKASFVISGNDVTLRGLSFTRMRVPDGNGAGIRAEGRNLTIEHCSFVNNQVAILAASQPTGTIAIADSEFSDNGACSAGGCLGAISTGPLARLRIERSSFGNPRGSQPEDQPAAAAQILSGAHTLELVSNRIEDGDGASSLLVSFNGSGALIMSDNRLEKGPRTPDSRGAILAAADGWSSPASVTLTRNTLVNHTGQHGVLLVDWTANPPRLDGNIIGDGDTAVSSRGIWRHRARYLLDQLIALKDAARHSAGSLLRSLRG